MSAVIDPEHKARVDAAVTRAFGVGVHVHLPQTEEAYAMCDVDENGHLVIHSKVLDIQDVVIDPRNN